MVNNKPILELAFSNSAWYSLLSAVSDDFPASIAWIFFLQEVNLAEQAGYLEKLKEIFPFILDAVTSQTLISSWEVKDLGRQKSSSNLISTH